MERATIRDGKIHPGIALAVLRSLQERDTPEESLEDEAFHQSLPRRLGLSDVVGSQIRRYSELAGRGGSLPAQEFLDLLRLIGRRPDAEAIFDDAGRRLAMERIRPRYPLGRLIRRSWPSWARTRAFLKWTSGAARALNPGAQIGREHAVPAITVRQGLLAAGGEGGACAILTGAATACAEAAWHSMATAVHVECEARDGECCRWTVEVQPD